MNANNNDDIRFIDYLDMNLSDLFVKASLFILQMLHLAT